MTFKDDELNWPGQPASTSHAEWHIYGDARGGNDVVYIWTRALMPFRVSAQDTPDLTVKIQGPQAYLWGTGWKEWVGDDSVDLSGSVPGTGLQRYVLVSIDGATSAAQLTNGDTYGEAVRVNPSGWPAPPSGSVPLALVRLTGGQTTIVEADIEPGRVIVSSAGGSVTPGVHHLIDATVHDDADTYAAPSRGEIVRFGASAWERLAADTTGAILIGDGTDIISDTTPTFVGLVTVNAGITMGGATGVNDLVIPDNLAVAFAIEDDGAAAPANIEYMRIVTTNAGPAQAVIFNNGEEDVDFRVAASGVTNALFVQGSDGFVGINKVPAAQLDIDQSSPAGNIPVLYLDQGDTGEACIEFSSDGADRDFELFRLVNTEAGSMIWDDSEDALSWDQCFRLGGYSGLDRLFVIDSTQTDGAGANQRAVVFSPVQQASGAGPAPIALAPYIEPQGAIALIYGQLNTGYLSNSNQNVTTWHNCRYSARTEADYTGTLTTVHVLHIADPTFNGSQAVNVRGLYIADINSGSGTNHAIYSAGGRSYHAGTLAVGGTNSVAAQLYVDQNLEGGAIPVLLLDQADLSEEFIEFKATVGAGNPIDTAALGAYYGKVRVMVTGVGFKWIALYN